MKLKAQVPYGSIQVQKELSKALTHVRCGWSIGVRELRPIRQREKDLVSAVLWGVTFSEDELI